MIFVVLQGMTETDLMPEDGLEWDTERKLFKLRSPASHEDDGTGSTLGGLKPHTCYTYAKNHLFSFNMKGRQFHENLCRLADYVDFDIAQPQEMGSPFRELFIDYGRFFAGTVATKLARDFGEWDFRIKAFDDEEYYEWYALMGAMFNQAGKNGVVLLGAS